MVGFAVPPSWPYAATLARAGEILQGQMVKVVVRVGGYLALMLCRVQVKATHR